MTVEAEHHPDPHDVASDLEMQATESAIYEVRKRAKRDQEPNANGEYEVIDCTECGSEIGEGRLKVSLKNHWCIYCATEHERRAKR